VVAIIGVGSYLPKKVLTNNDLAHMMDTTDEWITTRTGIKQRQIAAEGEYTSDLAAHAVKAALDNSGLKPDDLDGLIVATSTPDVIFPSTACIVQSKIGMEKGFAMDMNAVCAGFIYAMITADSLLKTGQCTRIAVVGAETYSRIVDWEDRSTCVLFGDGAGALILQKAEDQENNILGGELYANGKLGDILKVCGGISVGNYEAKLQMNGQEVFKNAINSMSKSAQNLLAKNKITVNQLDWVIAHQANQRILDSVAEKIGLPHEKMVSTISKHANTSAASIPLALDDYMKSGKIQKGDLVLMTGFGAGLAWGSLLVRI
jgi:3-oxoacyl-[acyl-carrier-protein] synthase-3